MGAMLPGAAIDDELQSLKKKYKGTGKSWSLVDYFNLATAAGEDVLTAQGYLEGVLAPSSILKGISITVKAEKASAFAARIDRLFVLAERRAAKLGTTAEALIARRLGIDARRIVKSATGRYVILGGCFGAGTHLRTEQGSRPIEDFRPDDLVLSRSENDPTGPLELRRVVETYVRTAQVLVLRMGGEEIRTTSEHPFWVEGEGWTQAANLRPGCWLQSHDGARIRLDGLEDTGEHERVYNLQVEGFHTYFVGCDEWGFSVWAHNADCHVTDFLRREGYSGRLVDDVLAAKGDPAKVRAALERHLTVRPSKMQSLVDEAVTQANRPLADLRSPARRHRLTAVDQGTVAKDVNTVFEPGVDVAGDVAAINAGRAQRVGDTFVVNGRTYGHHDGTLFPVSGTGLHTLDRNGFKALGVFNRFGDTERAIEILGRMHGMTPEAIVAGRTAWRAGQR